jgi:hypothetical protein
MFNKNFFTFFFAFLVIIGVAFGVLIVSSAFSSEKVDNAAHP